MYVKENVLCIPVCDPSDFGKIQIWHFSDTSGSLNSLWYLGYILAWTQHQKNKHNQNSFSEKLDTTSKRVWHTPNDHNLGHKYSDMWLCPRLSLHFGGCAQQKSTFAGHNLQNAVTTTSITASFLTNRSNSCRSGFKFRIEFGCAFGDEKDDHQLSEWKRQKWMLSSPMSCLERLQTRHPWFLRSWLPPEQNLQPTICAL